MKMRKQKKGFTITELVIVIAVIAVLAAVLIPTFVSLVRRANESKDIQLVHNLNTALTIDGEEHHTMQAALDAALESGYDVNKINASATGNEILWDSVNDKFCYLKEGKTEPEYIPDTELEGGVKPADVAYWQICDSMPETQKYSIYAGANWTEPTAITDLTVGFDAGENDEITSVTYIGMKNVTIRTNNDSAEVIVNNNTAEVYWYGKAGLINILNAAPSSVHIFGEAESINVANGRVVLEEVASVNEVKITGEDVAVETSVDVTINLSNEVTNTENISIKISNANANVHLDSALQESVEGGSSANVTSILRIDTYDNLVAALAAKVPCMKLDADIVATAKLTVKSNLELDLNGHKLSSSTIDTLLNVNTKKTLTVKDSVGNGEIANTRNSMKTNTTIELASKSVLNLQSGIITSSSTKKTSHRAIYCKYSTVNMTGGKIESQYKGIYGNGTVVVNISGGEIVTGTKGNYSAIEVNTANISGNAKIESSNGNYAVYVSSLTVTGNPTIKGNKYAVYANPTGTVYQYNISGGTFEASSSSAICLKQNVALTITGGELQSAEGVNNDILIDGCSYITSDSDMVYVKLSNYDSELIDNGKVLGYTSIVKVGGSPNFAKNKTIRLIKDIVTSENIIIKYAITLDLNGHKIERMGDANKAVTAIDIQTEGTEQPVVIQGNGTVIAHDISGNVDNGAIAINCSKGVVDLTIKSGTFKVDGNNENAVVYYGSPSAIGKIKIEGGTFITTSTTVDNVGQYVLNVFVKTQEKAPDYNFFEVSGGTFYNFDPSNCTAESPAKNYVTDGHTVTSETVGSDTIYTVS